MTQSLIDQVAKTLASQTSRRAALRAIGAGVAAALFGRPVLQETAALAGSSCLCRGGCCIPGTTSCVPPSSQGVFCGITSGMCQVCAPNTICLNGTCVGCNSASCASGCCQGGTCVQPASQGEFFCGSNGVSCQICPPPMQCINGNCVNLISPAPPPPPVCGPGSCNGCCLPAGGLGLPILNATQVLQSATCVPLGSQNTALCGNSGSLCLACPQGSLCVNGTCVGCNAGTCANGCCSGGTCMPYAGQTQFECGANGNVCAPCLNGGTCFNGVCVSCVGAPVGTPCGTGAACCDGACLPVAFANQLCPVAPPPAPAPAPAPPPAG